MVNLAELCAEMERSQRRLTPRAARDWWTKGLLPRPRRRGLGRQKGTVTFWVEPQVVSQAKATHDLLARHGRTYTAFVDLWLLGFPVNLRLVRSAWMWLVARNLPWEQSRQGKTPQDEAVGQLAAKVARGLLRPQSPVAIRHAATDFLNEFLSAFFGVDEESAASGLAELWAATAPFLSSGVQQRVPFEDTHLEWLIVRVRDWASLPQRRKTLRSARNYEFMRARRVIRVALGLFARAARSVPLNQQKTFEEFYHGVAIVFGRATLLPLIVILRDPTGRQAIPTLLDLSRNLKKYALGLEA